MSDRLSALGVLIRRVASLPGLGFLKKYVETLESSRVNFDQTKGDYEAQMATVKGLGGDAKKVVRGGDQEKPASPEDPEMAAGPSDDPEHP